MKVIFRSCFFYIDEVVFNLIARVYDLLLTIARVSPLSQGDIAAVADRIYSFLAIFMIFKVTFSLIMYVVNPDDFTEKTKGISKLTVNIILSLSLLILTPYIFKMAYDLQTIVLEDNSLAVLVFGDNGSDEEKFMTKAGDSMAFVSMSPFLRPDSSVSGLYKCATLIEKDETGEPKFNEECSGLDNDDLTPIDNISGTLYELANKDEDDTFTVEDLKNYVTGVNNQNLGFILREKLVTARVDNNFVMEYQILFSTAVGVVIILLLVTYCMDIAVRSIKLAFLQLIAPVPIISYVDPKSGKDGLFKKWYKMCFSTYLSLFIRLLTIYLAIFIISRVSDLKLVDIVDGSYETGAFLTLFIIIGALMFAKQAPKMLEGLGIKLDAGSFTLNPLRKIEKDALGGKMLKKPNDMLAKVGKGIIKSPVSGLSLFGKKAIGGIDAARNGEKFMTGVRNTHGKLYNNYQKKRDELQPMSAESRKNRIKGKRNQEQRNLREDIGAPAATNVNSALEKLKTYKDDAGNIQTYKDLNEWKEKDFAGYSRAKYMQELGMFKNSEYRESYKQLAELKVKQNEAERKSEVAARTYNEQSQEAARARASGTEVKIGGKDFDFGRIDPETKKVIGLTADEEAQLTAILEDLRLKSESAKGAVASAQGKVENAKKRHEDVKLKYGDDANTEMAYDEYAKSHTWADGEWS